MFKNHSVVSVAKRLAQLAADAEFVQVNVVGTSGFGKSELCYTLAHLMHKILEKDHSYTYGVRYMDKRHLLNVKQVFSEIGAPVIAVVDDISYFKSKVTSREFDNVMGAFTEIRHYTQRVVLFMNYHFGTAVPPLMRGASEMRFYLSMSPEDQANLLKIVGSSNENKLKWFADASRTARTRKYWVMKRGKFKLKYRWRKPFVLALLIEGTRPRFIVFPLRRWIDPHCSICDQQWNNLKNDGHDDRPMMDTKELAERMVKAYGPGGAKAGVRWVLQKHGHYTYSRTVTAAIKFLEKAYLKGNIDWVELMNEFGLKDKKNKSHPGGSQHRSRKKEMAGRKDLDDMKPIEVDAKQVLKELEDVSG